MLYIGCHLSASNGNLAMVRTAQELGGNTFAYFTRNPRGSKAKPENPDDNAAAVAAMKEAGFGQLVAHAAYTMNLCTADPGARAFAAEVLCDDVRRVAGMPGNFYNLHPGSHVGQGPEVATRQIADALIKALEPGYDVTILLETMAGKGSEMGGTFEQLKAIIDAVGSPKLGVCMDSCHIWDGGYDIVGNLDGVLKEFDEIIGIDRLKAVHFNDSMNVLGAHKDRHQKIGEGEIGLEAMKAVTKHPLLAGKPFILETPNDDEGYAREIAMIRGW